MDASEYDENPDVQSSHAQDDYVDRVRPTPADAPDPTVSMVGFLGDSDRAGFRRLYFTRDLDYYAEFKESDALRIESLAAEESPFRGESSTRVTLREDTNVDVTRSTPSRQVDAYDLDLQVRLAPDFRRYAGTHGHCGTVDTWCYQWTCFTDSRSCPEVLPARWLRA